MARTPDVTVRIKVISDTWSRAERTRRLLDRIIHAPRDAWLWLTEPVEPRRVAAAIAITLILGAAFTGTRDVSFWLVAAYVVCLDIEERARRFRKRRRERKQAKAKAIKPEPSSSNTANTGGGL